MVDIKPLPQYVPPSMRIHNLTYDHIHIYIYIRTYLKSQLNMNKTELARFARSLISLGTGLSTQIDSASALSDTKHQRLYKLAHLDFGLLVAKGNPSIVLTQLILHPLPQVELPAFCFPLLCALHEVFYKV